MNTVRKNERGFSLVIGMSILILLTVLGIAVMQTINSDIDSSASDKSAQSALAIAEAGVTWSLDYLQTQYQLNSATHQTFLDIVNNTKGDMSPASAATPEELYVCPPTTSTAPTEKCVGWQNTNWVIVTHGKSPQNNFGGGHFDVWVGLDPSDAAGNTLLVRSLGVDARTPPSQRLIEVAVAAGSGQTL